MKKIVAVLLIAVLFCCSMPMSVFAMRELDPEDQIEELDNVIHIIIDITETVPEIAKDAEQVNKVIQGFKNFISAAGKVGSILGVINGSVSFLKLIGVMKDPVTGKLDSIIDTLAAMTETLAQMDAKLDDITTKMTEMQAAIDFNHRTDMALHYENKWSVFTKTYMENGLDKLMDDYDGMCRNGIKNWCINETSTARRLSGIDNTRIFITYSKDKDTGALEQTFSYKNSIDASYPKDVPYVILNSSCIPDFIEWDINDYPGNIERALKEGIKKALAEGRYDAFETANYPALTEEGAGTITEEQLDKLCSDAVSSLAYRISAAKINDSDDFAREVARTFNNYATFMLKSGDGIDAAFNTYYFTHAFEYEVKNDLQLLCNELILKTGIYGQFAANVLGASMITTDAEKTQALCDMCDCIEGLVQAKKNGLTGTDRYSYITNSDMDYSTFHAEAEEEMRWYYSRGGYNVYNGRDYVPISYCMNETIKGDYPIGDTNMLVLANTLKSNGIVPSHEYFQKNIASYKINDYGAIVTSYKTPTTFTIGSERCRTARVIGSYFTDGAVFTSLPSDASSGHVTSRSKIEGGLYDMGSGSLISNKTLMLIGSYVENHWYWLKDEMAVFYGPANDTNVRMTKTKIDRERDTNVYHDLFFNVFVDYNVLVCRPHQFKLQAGNELDPLASFKKSWEEIAPVELGSMVYDDPDINSIGEVDMEDTVWNTGDSKDERSLEGCLQYLEDAMEAAGIPSGSLTDEEKEQCAARMMDMALAADEASAKLEDMRCEDPLGTGQNSRKLHDLACDLVPGYLLTDKGGLSKEVTDVFARLHYEPFIRVTFDEDGKPVLSTGWSVTPYLIVCTINREGTDVLNLEIPDELMQERKLRMDVILPRDDDGKGNVAVRCFDNEAELNELRLAAGVADRKDHDVVRFRSRAGEYAFIIDVDAEVPDTDDDSAVYAVTMVFAAAALTVLIRRRKRESTV